MTVLAVDPGRQKCGIAIVRADVPPSRLFLGVVPSEGAAHEVAGLCREHTVTQIVIGDSTGGASFLREIAALMPALPIQLVPERNTTQQARRLYWQENPPRGWRRLMPTSLQTPPRPWDDYAALLLAHAIMETVS